MKTYEWPRWTLRTSFSQGQTARAFIHQTEGDPPSRERVEWLEQGTSRSLYDRHGAACLPSAKEPACKVHVLMLKVGVSELFPGVRLSRW